MSSLLFSDEEDEVVRRRIDPLLNEDNVEDWEPNLTLRLCCKCKQEGCFICNPQPLIPEDKESYLRENSCLKCLNPKSKKNMFCELCHEDMLLKSNKLIMKNLESTLLGSATPKEQKKLSEKIKELKAVNNSILVKRRLDEKLFS